MQPQRPTFRPDLIAKPVTVAGKRLFEVCDPDTGRTLRFSEDGYSIAYLFNGKRSHAEVLEEFHKQRGIRMSPERLGQLIEHLEQLGCLVCDPNVTVAYSALATVAMPVLGDGGLDEAMATVALRAEAFKDYFTIVPDAIVSSGDATRPGKKKMRAASKAKAKLANARSIARTKTKAKAKASPRRPVAPPPIPMKARERKPPAPSTALASSFPEPQLPPLPAWPALDHAVGPARARPPVESRAAAPSHFSVPKPNRFPRARAHVGGRRSGYASAQSLWLAGGFFAASLLWASWALFRLGA